MQTAARSLRLSDLPITISLWPFFFGVMPDTKADGAVRSHRTTDVINLYAGPSLSP